MTKFLGLGEIEDRLGRMGMEVRGIKSRKVENNDGGGDVSAVALRGCGCTGPSSGSHRWRGKSPSMIFIDHVRIPRGHDLTPRGNPGTKPRPTRTTEVIGRHLRGVVAEGGCGNVGDMR